MQSLQEQYGPTVACFGCGPANPRGLHIRSFPEGDGLVCHWTPETWHEAFPGVLNGGIAGATFVSWSAYRWLDEDYRPNLAPPPAPIVSADAIQDLSRVQGIQEKPPL